VLHVHALTDVEPVDVVLELAGHAEQVKLLSELYVPMAHATHAPIAPIYLYYVQLYHSHIY
jgi:hypothetical protein